MDDFEQRFNLAIQELQDAGMSKFNANPPLSRLLRGLGLKFRPPFYATFWSNVIILGLWFGLSWGAVMYLLFWRSQDMPIWIAVFGGLFAGAFFGLAMAVHFRRRARKLGLSAWHDL